MVTSTLNFSHHPVIEPERRARMANEYHFLQLGLSNSFFQWLRWIHFCQWWRRLGGSYEWKSAQAGMNCWVAARNLNIWTIWTLDMCSTSTELLSYSSQSEQSEHLNSCYTVLNGKWIDELELAIWTCHTHLICDLQWLWGLSLTSYQFFNITRTSCNLLLWFSL